MRVAFITEGLGLGGSTTFLCNLPGELISRKIPAEVFSFEKANPLASDFSRLGIPVTSQDEQRAIFEDRLVGVLKELRRFQPSVVVANLSPPSFEVLRYVPDGIYRVGVAHSDDAQVYDMLRHYPRHLDLLAVVSETIRRKLSAMPDFAKVPIRYLPLGVPMADDPAATAREFNGPLRILYLGRLDREQKRVHLFPEILKQLQSSGIAFHWTIAGEGLESARLREAMTSTNPRQTVSFTGKVPYADVPKLLLGHHVLLLASDYEGLPLTVVEAMGGGLVPVVSDLPSGIRELVDETTGIRVAPENIAGYAEGIVWLDQHRDEMQKFSRNSRDRVLREFSAGAMTGRWLGAFSEKTKPIGAWPESWNILPPLPVAGSFRFTSAGRALRRLVFALRQARS